jgi:hypothetical protein
MHGKAKDWFEAYKLRKVIGDWPEFIGDVEAHFGVEDLTPSTTILGVAAHSSKVVQASGDISLEKPTRCSPVSSKEMMATTTEQTKPTLVQLAEKNKLQIAQSTLVLTSEYEKTKNRHLETVTQMAEPIVYFFEEVLTHVSGVSMFRELSVEPAEAVFDTSQTFTSQIWVFDHVKTQPKQPARVLCSSAP